MSPYFCQNVIFEKIYPSYKWEKILNKGTKNVADFLSEMDVKSCETFVLCQKLFFESRNFHFLWAHRHFFRKAKFSLYGHIIRNLHAYGRINLIKIFCSVNTIDKISPLTELTSLWG